MSMFRTIALVGLAACCFGAASAQDPAATHPAYWGSPSVDGGKCCSSLAEVRENIDRIDRQIIQRMAERGKYVAEAGRFKSDPGAVSAPARVEAIIARVRQVAAEEDAARAPRFVRKAGHFQNQFALALRHAFELLPVCQG